MGKLKSRKFWMAIIGAGFVVISEGLGLGITEEQYMGIAGIVMAYLVAQGYVDGQSATVVDEDQ